MFESIECAVEGDWRGIRTGLCPQQGRASVVIVECWKPGVNQVPCDLDQVGGASGAEGTSECWRRACCGANHHVPGCGGVQVRGQAGVGAEHALIVEPRQIRNPYMFRAEISARYSTYKLPRVNQARGPLH